MFLQNVTTITVHEMNSEFIMSVVFTGLTVVFIGLLLLVFFVWLFGKFFTKKPPTKKVSKPVEKVQVKSSQLSAPKIENGISDEVVAVISAAIAAMSSADGKTFAIRSIKATKATGRSAWATAGVVDNTRPF